MNSIPRFGRASAMKTILRHTGITTAYWYHHEHSSFVSEASVEVGYNEYLLFLVGRLNIGYHNERDGMFSIKVGYELKPEYIPE